MSIDAEYVFLGQAVLRLLPHQSPMRMIDGLDFINNDKVGTSFLVEEEDVFCRAGKLMEPGVIENIAQTAAIRVGYDHVSAFDGPINEYKPPFGYIGAIKGLKIFELPKAGDKVVTEAVTDTIIRGPQFDINFISATSRVGEVIIAKGEMKVFLQLV